MKQDEPNKPSELKEDADLAKQVTKQVDARVEAYMATQISEHGNIRGAFKSDHAARDEEVELLKSNMTVLKNASEALLLDHYKLQSKLTARDEEVAKLNADITAYRQRLKINWDKWNYTEIESKLTAATAMLKECEDALNYIIDATMSQYISTEHMLRDFKGRATDASARLADWRKEIEK
jgi:chromosome segregation ATPase